VVERPQNQWARMCRVLLLSPEARARSEDALLGERDTGVGTFSGHQVESSSSKNDRARLDRDAVSDDRLQLRGGAGVATFHRTDQGGASANAPLSLRLVLLPGSAVERLLLARFFGLHP
jgi:hypothetical protein